MRRYIITSGIILLIIMLLCSCSRLPNTYPFENKDQEIKSIELLYNPYVNKDEYSTDFVLIRSLEENEFAPFMKDIYSLETDKCITPPVCDFGEYVVFVNYKNGDMEIFASWHIEFVESGNNPTGVGAYYFLGDAFDNLFVEYSGTSDFSEYTIPNV